MVLTAKPAKSIVVKLQKRGGGRETMQNYEVI